MKYPSSSKFSGGFNVLKCASCSITSSWNTISFIKKTTMLKEYTKVVNVNYNRTQSSIPPINKNLHYLSMWIFDLEMFYLNTIKQLFLLVEQLDKLEVCLPYSRLLTGIPLLAVFQNLRWNSNKTSLIDDDSITRTSE